MHDHFMSHIYSFFLLLKGLIIAFTSDFIPKLVYRSFHSTDGTLTNYVNFTLSSVNPEDYDGKVNETCNYFGFRERKYPYDYTAVHYTILTWRLVFVLIFEVIIYSPLLI